MRKILRNVAIATATITSVATTVACASCTCSFEEKLELKSIDMNLPESKVVLETDQEWTSKPIDVQCFDQKKQPFEADVILTLSLTNGNSPDWIQINNLDRTIHINGLSQPASYTFDLQAIEAKEGLVKSDVQEFTVEVIPPPLFPPESIEVTCNGIHHTVFMTDHGNIQLGINAFCQEYPQELIDKECIWSITHISSYQITDLRGNDLFTLQPTIQDCRLVVSSDIDETYVGTYQLTINAVSHLDSSVSDDIIITIDILNGFYYYDETKNFTYTRNSLKENWSLSLIPSKCGAVNHVLTEIYGIPVSKIADNLCSVSGAKDVVSVILPESIIEVGDYAFRNQTYLYGLAMPSVKYVGISAFDGCFNLQLLDEYEQPTLCGVKTRAFWDCECLIFDDDKVHNLEYIGDDAFSSTSITSLNIGSQIKTIGANSFSHCLRLQYISLNATTPPKLSGQLYVGGTPLGGIYVPLKSVEIYKKTEGWSIYKDKIIGF